MTEGKPGTHLYIIRSGTVEVLVGSEAVYRIGAGDIVGEMTLIDAKLRCADVRAVTRVVAVPVDEKKFLELISKVPHFSLRVMRTMVRRIRNLNERLGE